MAPSLSPTHCKQAALNYLLCTAEVIPYNNSLPTFSISREMPTKDRDPRFDLNEGKICSGFSCIAFYNRPCYHSRFIAFLLLIWCMICCCCYADDGRLLVGWERRNFPIGTVYQPFHFHSAVRSRSIDRAADQSTDRPEEPVPLIAEKY